MAATSKCFSDIRASYKKSCYKLNSMIPYDTTKLGWKNKSFNFLWLKESINWFYETNFCIIKIEI